MTQPREGVCETCARYARVWRAVDPGTGRLAWVCKVCEERWWLCRQKVGT